MPLFFGVMAAMALAVIIRPDLGRGSDATMNRVGAAIFMLAACLGIVFWLLPIPVAMRARHQTKMHRTSVVQGCVRNFERDVHPNGHGMSDTYFSLGGRSYHFSSSPWWPGFHNENDLIHSADGLRVMMSGQHVIGIEKLAAGCT